ncbi:MAG: hypothetical protein JST67_10395 [Bacteroidetes bacterium]|nr:hypothetical protein [Bacteroidota bacterium]
MLVFSVLFNITALFMYRFYEGGYVLKQSPNWFLFGLSYLALQCIAYNFTRYYERKAGAISFFYYVAATLYVPKFFMGPISALQQVQEDIKEPKSTAKITALNRMLLGLFKKVVLAESLSLYVSSVLDFQDAYPMLTLVAGACLYSLQLYFDFSGYCDIAIGASALWGISLPENFFNPFSQKTWAHFWKSWHASLTNWLWQFLFIPCYSFFNRKKIQKTTTQVLSVFVVFVGMAFFNGLKSGFFISAFLFALFYIAEFLFFKKEYAFSKVCIFVLFSVALLFFRNPDYTHYSFFVVQLLDVKKAIPVHWLKDFWAPLASGGTLHDYFNFFITLLLALSYLLFEKRIMHFVAQNEINYVFLITLLFLIVIWGVFVSGSRFVYMQF